MFNLYDSLRISYLADKNQITWLKGKLREASWFKIGAFFDKGILETNYHTRNRSLFLLSTEAWGWGAKVVAKRMGRVFLDWEQHNKDIIISPSTFPIQLSDFNLPSVKWYLIYFRLVPSMRHCYGGGDSEFPLLAHLGVKLV